MKRIMWLGGFGIVVIMALAFYLALDMGQKSPIYAAGRIELDPALARDAQGIATLYIIVNDPASPMPMPLGAVKERLEGDFSGSIPFFLTKEKMIMMNPDAPMPQVLRLKARLDMDGLAGMDQPGDLVGIIEGVNLGASDLTIRIDRRIQ